MPTDPGFLYRLLQCGFFDQSQGKLVHGARPPLIPKKHVYDLTFARQAGWAQVFMKDAIHPITHSDGQTMNSRFWLLS